ncbi:MAG: RHS repeat-associated core domain-containing protein [Chloroflexi bacterium]|nr:RHS repeat-associated core domain-containing protein [Chloroflexota bacterium]
MKMAIYYIKKGCWGGIQQQLMIAINSTSGKGGIACLTHLFTSIAYKYSGLGDRLQQIAGGATTSYTLDINAGLTQVLQDNTNTYLYGPSTGSGQASRIAQVAETQAGYFLPDALGSMRQMTDASAALILTRNYDPYGNVVTSNGASETVYGYTGEVQLNGLVHLRARDYAPYLNQFIQLDTILPDAYQPQQWNRYSYTGGNPVNYIDPSGMIRCYKDEEAECLVLSTDLLEKAKDIQGRVISRATPPVAGFAELVGDAYKDFGNDYRGMMWGLTRVINGMDPNRKMPIWYQGWQQITISSNDWVGQDWLPFNNPSLEKIKDKQGLDWIYSERGDWRKEYWDKTPNQAYHFWFYAAIAYFDEFGRGFSEFANINHDPWFQWEEIDFDDPRTPPPARGASKQDYDLSLKGIELGHILRWEDALKRQMDPCDALEYVNFFDPEAWILSNLR